MSIHHDTRKLSAEARTVINVAILDWLRDNLINLNHTCILSEVFNSKRKASHVRSMRDSLKAYLRNNLICKRTGGPWLEHVEMRMASCMPIDRSDWTHPSLSLLGTMTGLDHSALVERIKT